MSAVKDIDRGAKAMIERIRALAASKATVRVGVLTDAPKKKRESVSGKYSLVEVAAVHEYGAPAARIPQRSFIRAPVDEHAADIARLQKVLLAQVVEGKIELKPALDAMGSKIAAWCQNAISDGIAPALAPATVAKKKSSKPLVDTGQLKSSITWVVEG